MTPKTHLSAPPFLEWSAAQVSQSCCLEEPWKRANALLATQADGKQLTLCCRPAGFTQLDTIVCNSCVKCVPSKGPWTSPGIIRLSLLHRSAVHSLTLNGRPGTSHRARFWLNGAALTCRHVLATHSQVLARMFAQPMMEVSSCCLCLLLVSHDTWQHTAAPELRDCPKCCKNTA